MDDDEEQEVEQPPPKPGYRQPSSSALKKSPSESSVSVVFSQFVCGHSAVMLKLAYCAQNNE